MRNKVPVINSISQLNEINKGYRNFSLWNVILWIYDFSSLIQRHNQRRSKQLTFDGRSNK